MAKWIELNDGELVNLENIKTIFKSVMLRDNEATYLIEYDEIDEFFADKNKRNERFEDIKKYLRGEKI